MQESKLTKQQVKSYKNISPSTSSSFVNPEWTELVEFISKEDVYPYLTEIQFWDCVKTNLKVKLYTSVYRILFLKRNDM